MKIFKRFVSVLMSMLTLAAGSFALPLHANAEVLRPEIIKVENWTTTYFVDNTQPYPLQCEADIYNDGSMNIYFWSGYKWTGFRTVSHDIIFSDTKAYSMDSIEYTLKNGSKYTEEYSGTTVEYTLIDKGVLANCNLSYFDNRYRMEEHGLAMVYGWRSAESNDTYKVKRVSTTSSWGGLTDEQIVDYKVKMYGWQGYLVDFPQEKSTMTYLTFKPTVEPTTTFNFHILGHDIVITPELLSTTTYTEPIDETEAMIHELESQINDLNTELEQLRAEKEVWEQNETHLLEDIELLYKENEVLVARRGDINDDGLFTVADAVLLMRYVAGTIDTIPYKKIN